MNCKLFTVISLLLCVCLLAAACGDNSTDTQSDDNSPNANYSVKVFDCFGEPITEGVVALFMQDGQQKAMQVVNDKGIAVKNLEKGDYVVELKFTDSNAAYSYEKGSLSASKTETAIELFNTPDTNGADLYVGGKETKAYNVTVGGTLLELKKGERNYYLFTPTVAGTYEFTTSDKDAAIGYYGVPSFVQEQSAAEVVDNSFTISVSDSMIGKDKSGTTVIVVGIDSADLDSCVLKIKRIGDPKYSISDEPWTIYKPKTAPTKFTLENGVKLKNFDITAKTEAYKLVYNEADGSYHLGTEDGARVYVWLTEEPAYMACFKTVLESVGMNRYFFDENGEFVKKESYTECLTSYIDCADTNAGVYPLTKDLEYIIKQCGENYGWWKADSHGFIFYSADEVPLANLNTNLAWLFMCCYAE